MTKMYGSLEVKKGKGSDDDGSPPRRQRRLPPGRSSARRAGFEPGTSKRALGRKSASARRFSERAFGGGGGGHAKPVLKSIYHTVRATERFKSAARRRREQRRRLDDASGSPQYSSTVGGSTCGGGGHSWLYTLLNPRSHRPHAVFFKRFMAAVICVDLCFFVCSTEPRWEGLPVFYYAEGVTSAVFLVEYAARLVTCAESRRFRPHGPILGRVRYMLTAPAIIDALATFPFFLELMTPLDLPTMTYLRVFRLLRILKTEGFAKAFDSVNRVIYFNREILWVAAMLCIFLVLVTAVAMYYLRPKHDKEDEADFSSIAATMYLTTLMLTGQGGPAGDLPWYTQSVVLLTGIFSVAMFAIPASMLTWGFEAEAERLAQRARRRKMESFREEPPSSTSESSDAYASSSSIDTSDEEYQKIIGGGDEDEAAGAEDDPEKARAMQEILDMFTRADDDGSGTLTKQEFVKMVEPLLEAAGAGAPSFAAAVDGAPDSGNGQAGGALGVGGAAQVGKGPSAASAIASAVKSGSSMSEVMVLSTRVARLEAKVDAMTSKLDRLIQMSEKPGDRAFQDPFP